MGSPISAEQSDGDRRKEFLHDDFTRFEAVARRFLRFVRLRKRLVFRLFVSFSAVVRPLPSVRSDLRNHRSSESRPSRKLSSKRFRRVEIGRPSEFSEDQLRSTPRRLPTGGDRRLSHRSILSRRDRFETPSKNANDVSSLRSFLFRIFTATICRIWTPISSSISFSNNSNTSKRRISVIQLNYKNLIFVLLRISYRAFPLLLDK